MGRGASAGGFYVVWKKVFHSVEKSTSCDSPNGGGRMWAGVASPAGMGGNSPPPVQGWPTMGGERSSIFNIQFSRAGEGAFGADSPGVKNRSLKAVMLSAGARRRNRNISAGCQRLTCGILTRSLDKLGMTGGDLNFQYPITNVQQPISKGRRSRRGGYSTSCMRRRASEVPRVWRRSSFRTFSSSALRMASWIV